MNNIGHKSNRLQIFSWIYISKSIIIHYSVYHHRGNIVRERESILLGVFIENMYLPFRLCTFPHLSIRRGASSYMLNIDFMDLSIPIHHKKTFVFLLSQEKMTNLFLEKTARWGHNSLATRSGSVVPHGRWLGPIWIEGVICYVKSYVWSLLVSVAGEMCRCWWILCDMNNNRVWKLCAARLPMR